MTRSAFAIGARPRRAARGAAILAGQGLVVAAVIVAWQLAATHGLVNSFFFGRPTAVWHSFVAGMSDGTLPDAARVTLQEALIGLLIGGSLGILSAFLLAASMIGREVVAPMFVAAYAVPRFTLAPLFVVWFGLGMSSKLALVALVAFFYTFISTYQGACEVDQELVAVVRLMRGSRWQTIWKVTVPSTMVWVALSLKQATPNAFQGAIVGELFAANMGLGVAMTLAANRFDTNGLLAAVFTTTILAIGLYAVVQLVVRYSLRWRAAGGTQRGAL